MMHMLGTQRRPRADAKPRWLIDRRVVALLFLAFTTTLTVHAAERLGQAFDEDTLHSSLLFVDKALKALVAAAFTVFVYRRKPSRRPSRSPLAFVACAAAILPAAFLAPSPAADAAIWAVVVGESIVVVAVGWTLVSVLCLGTCFGVLPEVRGLVTRGPYRYMRHPVYLGEIAAFAGFVLALQQPLSILALAVFCAGQAVRLRMEEAALTEAFPDEYGAFAARTPRLVPRLRATSDGVRSAPAAAGSEAVAPAA